ncbi:prenyltransferase/squalene oxidase repeat-containing protein [Nonomuraea sp. NPDC049637]|uniref:prenyltransferase/squalene oxidase repeat-containing protein n=1 Tax=Nonomuraea sp. NPDC049637 TaxID=3154356 RepID=UPI00342EF3E4
MTDVRRSVELAVDALFDRQRVNGSWQDHLPSAPIATASAIVALHFADPVGSASLIRAGAAWLRAAQSDDGGWGDAAKAPSTFNVTPMATGALSLIDPEGSAEHIRRGLERIEGFGGMEAVADRDICKIFLMCQQFLSLGGLYDERKIMRLPLEIIFLPRMFRQKVSFTVPWLLLWGMMQAHTRPWNPLRRAVNRVCERPIFAYLDELEQFEGEDGGYQESPFMVALACLALARAGLRRDIVERCIAYLHRTVRPDGSWPVNRDLELCATTFVTHGLQDTGYASDERLAATREWIRDCQRHTRFSATGCPPGGWGWSWRCGWPNTDDTADALIALARFGDPRTDGQVRAGVDWLVAMQSRNGSWSCFCRNNPIALDGACSVMSAHAVTALRESGGLTAADRPIARALAWFRRNQREDGSFTTPWYRGLVAGTGNVLDALAGLGLADDPTARRCRDWLLANQNPDGGWGQDEFGASTAEDTAWALLGLLGSGPASEPAVQDGVAWLVSHQRPDGLWQPTILGMYFLDLKYSCDLLAAGYALQALARYRQATAPPGPGKAVHAGL